MAERALLLRNMLRTLREGQDLIAAEMGQPPGARPMDAAQLLHIHNAAVELASQATSLVLLMEEQAANRALIEEARSRCEFFLSIVTRTMFATAASRRRS